MIAVVDPGPGNLRSVMRALTHVGGQPVLTADPGTVRHADKIVFPGQGHFASAMVSLRATGMDRALKEAIAAGTPYLGICLGMQVLFDYSHEGAAPGLRYDVCPPGLGVIGGSVRRLLAEKLPHVGWNWTIATGDGEWRYYSHSYAPVPDDPSVTTETCTYAGQVFTAGIERANVRGVQYHPEKSGAGGLVLLKEWVRQ